MKVAVIGKGTMGTQIYDYLVCHNVKTSILGHTDAFDLLVDYDIIIESVIEDLIAKQNIFARLHKICRKDTIFATNTSSLCVEDMQIPGRTIVGIHFMNPVKKINTIELVYPKQITTLCILKITNFLDSIQKKYFVVSDTKGFIVNRILITFIHEALKLTADHEPDTIDALMLNCCKFPIGPLKLGDMIGWDIIATICKNIDIEICAELKNMLYTQRLGRKTKYGVYRY